MGSRRKFCKGASLKWPPTGEKKHGEKGPHKKRKVPIRRERPPYGKKASTWIFVVSGVRRVPTLSPLLPEGAHASI